jgi:RNA polymerase sigma factor (sigma-70 family)
MIGDDRYAESLSGIGTAARREQEERASPQTRSAFIAFYDDQFHLVVRFVMRVGASPEDAHDAAQEAFLEAWALAQQPTRWQQISDPTGWIRAVALYKYRRPPGPRRRPVTLAVAELPDSSDHALGTDELTAQTLDVLTALRALDEDTRTVMAFHLDGFSCAAIARQMGMSDQKARDLLKKARKLLGRMLGKQREGGRS